MKWPLRSLGALALLAVPIALLSGLVGSPLGRGEPPSFVVRTEKFLRQAGASGNLRAVKSTPLVAPIDADSVLKISWLLPDGSKAAKGDVVVRFDPTDFQKQLEDGKSDRSSADAKIQKEKTLVDTAERGRSRTAELSQAELEKTREFQSKDAEIFSRNQIIESEIDEKLSTAKMTHDAEAQTIETSLSKTKLDLLSIERRKADLVVAQAQKGLQALEIRAVHDGVVVFVPDWRGNLPHVGDSVWPGQTVATLPLLDEMEAEVFVLEADAGGLKAGKVATVVLEAHPEVEYPAKIKSVDTLAKPRVRGVPTQYFAVTLEFERTDKAVMKPGARVHATIVLDHEMTLVAPRLAVFEDHGKTVVYRWNGDRFAAVPVKLGASSPGRVVIAEGLEDGDRIALRDPTRAVEGPAADGDSAKTAPGR